jgi:hypothetical protein
VNQLGRAAQHWRGKGSNRRGTHSAGYSAACCMHLLPVKSGLLVRSWLPSPPPLPPHTHTRHAGGPLTIKVLSSQRAVQVHVIACEQVQPPPLTALQGGGGGGGGEGWWVAWGGGNRDGRGKSQLVLM